MRGRSTTWFYPGKGWLRGHLPVFVGDDNEAEVLKLHAEAPSSLAGVSPGSHVPQSYAMFSLSGTIQGHVTFLGH